MEVENYQENKLHILGKLTATLIHEIRNPLSALKLSLEYLKMVQENVPEDIKETIDTCTNAAERIQTLIDNLSPFTRKTYNGTSICSINEVTLESINIMNTNALGRTVVINKKLDEELPQIVFDRNKLLQVYLNLITNAIEACESNGVINIRTYRDKDSSSLIWEIEDNGAGISEDDKINIFNDFYTSKTKGTGLGLSVCQSILKDYQCDLKFESQLGVGTKFRVLINSNLTAGKL